MNSVRPLQTNGTGFMANTIIVSCDGCGQRASTDHIARRLKRLEWTTRYRPVHIHTLLLGSVSPREEKDFLYSPDVELCGEAALALQAVGISATGKTAEAVHAEFQRGGFFLTHVLECPMEREGEGDAELVSLLQRQLATVLTRIRRSLKPKRLVLISGALENLQKKIAAAELGCAILLDGEKPFVLDAGDAGVAARLHEALAAWVAY
jgi:hypothetical protein